MAGLIKRKLIRTKSIKIHPLDVRMACAAALGDLFLIGDADIPGGWRHGEFLVLFRRVAAMAVLAGDALLGVDASFGFVRCVGVTVHAGILFWCGLGVHKTGKTKEPQNTKNGKKSELLAVH